uniref:Peroxisomal membrane protein PEX16 n=1 Tax=Heterorhabditis bacteriophora TaxID=37862 RepID=A0A1I7X298_HETBA
MLRSTMPPPGISLAQPILGAELEALIRNLNDSSQRDDLKLKALQVRIINNYFTHWIIFILFGDVYLVATALQNFKSWMKEMAFHVNNTSMFETKDLTRPMAPVPEETLIESFLNLQIPADQKSSPAFNKSLADEFYIAQSKALAFINIMGKLPAFYFRTFMAKRWAVMYNLIFEYYAYNFYTSSTLRIFRSEKTGLYVKLFKIIFSPYLPELIRKSTELALSAREPLNYFLLLRALFRSIGGGAHDILYGQFLPLLPNLLQFLNKLQVCCFTKAIYTWQSSLNYFGIFVIFKIFL